MNELSSESSPYLLQHAENPIFWKSWNNKTLQSALDEHKLIVVSIGYSTCHWCHVMEHESFETKEVAQLMNSHFISIKIDREERPDLDAFYMKAVQLMTKQGGWPLNVVCLPNGSPIWGGTYFPKENWLEALTQLHHLFISDEAKMNEFASQLHEGITFLSGIPQAKTVENASDTEDLIDKWKKSFDWEFGGYSRAPKFMMPNNLSFLQKYGYLHEDESLLSYVDLTLTKMAWGGLFDTVLGGFSRYSVDHQWHIPHFEKMLYDNAQLLSLYADAYKRTSDELYKNCIEKTIRFIEATWENGEGGFYSALDADSLTNDNRLIEGAYYSWTKEALQALIGDDFPLFEQLFNINPFGYWEDDLYVLIQSESLEIIAAKNKLSLSELKDKKQQWEEILLEERNKRPAPRLDDKTLTAWNALLIVGYLDAYSALDQVEYLEKAQKIHHFISTKMWSEESGLYHTYKNGKATISGFLDDYAMYIHALISLFENTLDEKYIKQAKQLTDYCLDVFFNDAHQFFNFSQHNDHSIITNAIEIEDNVIPSSNSYMAMNLIKLGILYENAHYNKLAENMVNTIKTQIDYASAYSNWLIADLYLSNPSELAITGTDALVQTQAIKRHFISKTAIFGATTASTLAFFDRRFDSEQTMFYFCQMQSCQKPETDALFLQNQIL